MTAKKSTATLLVEIAEGIFVFGCVSEQRARGTDDRVAVHTYASPRNNLALRRPLPDIRSDLADVYALTYGSVPSASALGDAMMVLEGRARKSEPIQLDPDSLSAFLSGGRTIATQLVEMAHERFTLGVTMTGEAYAVAIGGPNVARVLRGGRRSLRAELARLYYEQTNAAANAQALADALLVLEGEAQRVDPSEVALRVGQVEDALVLDLGTDDGRVVVVRGGGDWDVEKTSPVLFWRTNATLPLPEPYFDGTLDPLRALLNVSDADWPLVVAWLVCALFGDMPHPVLLLRGEHGTAKPTAARLLTSLIDRCAAQLRTAPRNVEDWAVACAGSWVTCLDNVSELQPWLQDAICRAVTGDGLLRRQLYTDSDVSVLAFRRVIALTSIDPGRLGGDLADRLLSIELERIGDEARWDERRMTAQWSAVHASVLGGLLHVASKVYARLPGIRNNNLPRMADFARVVLAVDDVLGSTGYDTFAEQAGQTAELVANSDSVAVAIRERILTVWHGTASELLTRLTADRPPKDWPSTPQGMGGRLARLAPTLRALGWTVDQVKRQDKKGSRGWRLTPPVSGGNEEVPAETSETSATSEGGLFDAATDVADVTDNRAGTSSFRPEGGTDASRCQQPDCTSDPVQSQREQAFDTPAKWCAVHHPETRAES